MHESHFSCILLSFHASFLQEAKEDEETRERRRRRAIITRLPKPDEIWSLFFVSVQHLLFFHLPFSPAAL